MDNLKKTLVLGGSLKEHRYSNKAIRSLRSHGYEVVSIGNREGIVGDVDIFKELKPFLDVDTITIYLSDRNQKSYYDYIFSLNPKRLIFNPGAENFELSQLAGQSNIEVLNACTLVMLSLNQY